MKDWTISKLGLGVSGSRIDGSSLLYHLKYIVTIAMIALPFLKTYHNGLAGENTFFFKVSKEISKKTWRDK